ncbi:hypothetical protein [Streptomyces wuyuanensis]|uniref:hypothetical protein n=1 Tax=Streptomyces wuyuanensis TaxID=1196353 RepID=UPI003D71A888
MTSRDPDQPPAPAVDALLLAAEAALLEGRLRMLREALDTVDARMEAVSDSLRRLRHAAYVTHAADRVNRRGASEGGESVPLPHDACPGG